METKQFNRFKAALSACTQAATFSPPVIFFTLLLLPFFPSAVQAQTLNLLHPHVFELMNAGQKISFVQFGKEHPLAKPRVKALAPGEGGDGYVAEPCLSFRFPVLQKRMLRKIMIDTVAEKEKDMFIRPLMGYTRVLLNYHFHTKIKKTRSSPILPPTNSFGIQLDRMLYLKRLQHPEDKPFGAGVRNAFQFKKTVHGYFDEENLFFVYLSLILHHYSNGQDGPELLRAQNRGNYLDGNFSTNFFYPRVTTCWTDKKNWLYHFTLGFQREIGRSDGFLSLEKTQSDRRYGMNRLNYGFQARGNFRLDKAKTWVGRQLNFFEWRVRTEVAHILDEDLSNYPYGQKYRSDYHLFLEVNHVYVRSLGLFAHFYWGRDPLNIRYDDPIRFMKFGITIDADKFTMRRDDVSKK